MSTLRETLEDLAGALRERPDDLLLEIGAGGELLVARLRVFVSCLLMLLPEEAQLLLIDDLLGCATLLVILFIQVQICGAPGQK